MKVIELELLANYTKVEGTRITGKLYEGEGTRIIGKLYGYGSKNLKSKSQRK